MTKNELYTNVSNLMAEFETQFKSKKSFEQFKVEIDNLIKPKTGGGVVQFPMITIVDEETKEETRYHYCRYTTYYIPEDEIVMSNGKSKGYSKKAIGLWNKMGRDAKALNDEAMKLLLSKDLENGTLKAQEADALKDARNKSESYDSIREAYEDIRYITEA